MPRNNPPPWAPRKDEPRRRGAFRPLRRVLILCEDEKSSKFYFDAFPINRRFFVVQAVGTGYNTDSLIRDAIRRKNAAIKAGTPYSEVYCVFDRDSFPADNFNSAFALAGANGIKPIWTNEAFELWYLLHFDLIVTAMPRTAYEPRLSKKLDAPYLKNDKKIYSRVVNRQAKAIQHARRLDRHWIEMQGKCVPEHCNPSTNVHELVAFLNELIQLGSNGTPAT